MKKIFIILLLSSIIASSCGEQDVILKKDFIIIDNVQQNNDGTFEISLRNDSSTNKSSLNVHFSSKFRLQAGDTLWSRYQLYSYSIDKITAANMENASLKDSLDVLRTSLKNSELENQLLKNYYYSSLKQTILTTQK